VRDSTGRGERNGSGEPAPVPSDVVRPGQETATETGGVHHTGPRPERDPARAASAWRGSGRSEARKMRRRCSLPEVLWGVVFANRTRSGRLFPLKTNPSFSIVVRRTIQ